MTTNTTPAVERLATAQIALAIISEKAQFHRERAADETNLAQGLDEIIQTARKALTPSLAPVSEPVAGSDLTDRFWLILREPGMVPNRKGPFKRDDAAKVLREFMAANPTAYIDHLTIGADGSPDVEHGPLVLQYLDGRSMSVGKKHNERVRAAEAALPPSKPDAVTMPKDWCLRMAEFEGDAEIGAGVLAIDPTTPLPDAPTIPEGMVPWHGGDAAPEDWDGGPARMRCGEDICAIGITDWRHLDNDADIIAYTPVVRPAATGLEQMIALDEEIEAEHPGWMTGQPAATVGEAGRLREALAQCRDQFAFYAREHYAKADNPATYYKDAERYREKAETNERFANIARAALGENRP